MTTVLGIDPGSRTTGYGVLSVSGTQYRCLAHGYIPTQTNTLPERLFEIHQGIVAAIEKYQPDEAAIEQIFTCHNHQSALKLGQARGAALVACAQYAIPVFEYSAKAVKRATVGYGAASKSQIQHMVQSLLQLKHVPQEDAADGLAIAVCHSHHRTLNLEKAADSQN